MESSQPSGQPRAMPSLRIMWVAFMGVFVVYGALAYLVDISRTAPPAIGTLTTVFGTLAAIQIVVALVAPGILVGRVADYRAACFIRWGLVEAAALYGVLLRCLGATRNVSLAFVVVGACVFLLLRPSEDAERAFRKEPGR